MSVYYLSLQTYNAQHSEFAKKIPIGLNLLQRLTMEKVHVMTVKTAVNVLTVATWSICRDSGCETTAATTAATTAGDSW